MFNVQNNQDGPRQNWKQDRVGCLPINKNKVLVGLHHFKHNLYSLQPTVEEDTKEAETDLDKHSF